MESLLDTGTSEGSEDSEEFFYLNEIGSVYAQAPQLQQDDLKEQRPRFFRSLSGDATDTASISSPSHSYSNASSFFEDSSFFFQSNHRDRSLRSDLHHAVLCLSNYILPVYTFAPSILYGY